jgi:hypothetical protein
VSGVTGVVEDVLMTFPSLDGKLVDRERDCDVLIVVELDKVTEDVLVRPMDDERAEVEPSLGSEEIEETPALGEAGDRLVERSAVAVRVGFGDGN